MVFILSLKIVMCFFVFVIVSCGFFVGLGDYLMFSIVDVLIFCNFCLRYEVIVNEVIF